MRVKKRKKQRKSIIWVVISIVIIILLIVLYYISAIFKTNDKVVVEVNTEYQDKIKVISFFKDVTSKITKEGKVNTEKTGSYTLDYKYKSILGITKHKKVNIEVVDKTAPTIELTGGDKMEVFLNEEYTEPGYTVKDNYDQDLEVTIDGKVDTSKTGHYYLVYKTEDKSRNKTEVVRKVTVERVSPLTMDLKDFNLDTYFDGTILKETETMPKDYLENMVIAGDSVPWQFGLNNVFPSEKVWAKPCEGPFNFDSQKVYVNNVQTNKTLSELIVENKPQYLALHMGVCDTNNGDVEAFINAYDKVIDYISENSPDTKLIVMSLMPQTQEYLSWISLRNNTKLNKYNYYLAELCYNKGVKFLNAATAVKNSEGRGNPNLFFDDGYHPNVTGMKKILDYMNNHGYKE